MYIDVFVINTYLIGFFVIFNFYLIKNIGSHFQSAQFLCGYFICILLKNNFFNHARCIRALYIYILI